MSNGDEFRIMILGANGLLGTELVSVLAPLGTLIRCTRSARRMSPESVLVDLSDGDMLRRAIRKASADLIVNSAAYTAVDAAEAAHREAYEINGVAPGIIGEEAARRGATVIHFSTDYVFSGHGQAAWREEDLPSPINRYGQSKLAGERNLMQSGARHLVVRTAWLYGLGRPGFVNRIIRAAQDKREIRVVDDSYGTPTSARFVALTVAQLAQGLREDSYPLSDGEILHVVCSGSTTWCGFAHEVFDKLHRLGCISRLPRVEPASSATLAAPAKRPKNSVLSIERLERLGVSRIPNWRDELSENILSIFEATIRESPVAEHGGNSCVA